MSRHAGLKQQSEDKVQYILLRPTKLNCRGVHSVHTELKKPLDRRELPDQIQLLYKELSNNSNKYLGYLFPLYLIGH